MHDGWVAGLLLVDICEVAGEKKSIAVSDTECTHLMIEKSCIAGRSLNPRQSKQGAKCGDRKRHNS
jgi:hypothetical protein